MTIEGIFSELETKKADLPESHADTLGKIDYALNQQFDPYVGEQEDGSYLVSETMYNLLKDHTKFKNVNFVNKTKTNELSTKVIDIFEINKK